MNHTWVLLLYGYPRGRARERMDLWRKLRRFGCIALNTSAYILPDNPSCLERLQWLAKQVQDAGGDATVSRVNMIDGLSDAEILSKFQTQADEDYSDLLKETRKAQRIVYSSETALRSSCKKFRRRYEELRESDYFDANKGRDVLVAISEWENRVEGVQAAKLPALNPKEYQNMIWRTRPQPGIDRCASAWFIRRFIDKSARFEFKKNVSRKRGFLSFDMLDATFTHVGDKCTFETLCEQFNITEKPVREIAKMIHDADLEDGKYDRHEAIGINLMLKGFAQTGVGDSDILERGIGAIDAIYSVISGTD